MPQTLPALETQRSELLRALSDLGDMRRGSVVGAIFRCRKLNCHCSHPGDAGHGPIMRLTHKVHALGDASRRSHGAPRVAAIPGSGD